MEKLRKITEWCLEERPREKLINKGAEALTSAELLAIIIKNGVKGKSNAYDIALNILHEGGGTLAAVARLSFAKLISINGVGSAKAAEILAAIEISKRFITEMPSSKINIYSSKEAAAIMNPILQNLDHEECWVIYLSTANTIISKERISIGGIKSTVIDVKIIIKKAIEKLASGLILVHNHPSGNRKPSESDIKQTEILRNAANLFDIILIDHIIITKGKHYSFCDEGL